MQSLTICSLLFHYLPSIFSRGSKCGSWSLQFYEHFKKNINKKTFICTVAIMLETEMALDSSSLTYWRDMWQVSFSAVFTGFVGEAF